MLATPPRACCKYRPTHPGASLPSPAGRLHCEGRFRGRRDDHGAHGAQGVGAGRGGAGVRQGGTGSTAAPTPDRWGVDSPLRPIAATSSSLDSLPVGSQTGMRLPCARTAQATSPGALRFDNAVTLVVGPSNSSTSHHIRFWWAFDARVGIKLRSRVHTSRACLPTTGAAQHATCPRGQPISPCFPPCPTQPHRQGVRL